MWTLEIRVEAVYSKCRPAYSMRSNRWPTARAKRPPWTDYKAWAKSMAMAQTPKKLSELAVAVLAIVVSEAEEAEDLTEQASR